MDGSVSFNRAFYPDDDTGAIRETAAFMDEFMAESVQRRVRLHKKIFISHKTNDHHAENLARDITRRHRLVTYLAEWDPNANTNSPSLPNYIMGQIHTSQGFLVSVRPQIAISMWVGYEIGGAHAYGVPRAKIMFNAPGPMPSVVEALKALHNRSQLDAWITTNV